MARLPGKDAALALTQDALAQDDAQGLTESFRTLGWEVLDPAPDPATDTREAWLLAHPRHGLALLDLAPARHPLSVGALRQRLDEAGLEAGSLPIVHRALQPGDAWRLSGILDQAFGEATPREPPANDWIAPVRQALAPASPLAAPEQRHGPPALLLFWCGLLGLAGVTAGILQVLGPPAPSLVLAEDPPAAAVAAAPPPVAPAAFAPPPAAPPPAAPPAAPVQATAPVETAAALPLPPPAAPSLPPEPSPADAATPRIFVHHLAAAAAPATALAAQARALGGAVELRRVAATPPGRVVRYFRDEDLPLAQRLAARLGAGWQPQDLTHFAPRPSPGTLEVWLP